MHYCDLKTVYNNYRRHVSFGKHLLFYTFIILFGAIIGYLSEWLEYAIYDFNGLRDNALIVGLTMVFDNFSFWIFSATLIAYFSFNPYNAGSGSFLFLISMCTFYFIPKQMHYGYDTTLQFATWGIVSLISIIPAVIIWFSRGLSKLGIFIKGLPAAAILGEFAHTVYHCIDYYSPIPGMPAEPLKWLLQPERITQLSIYLVLYIFLLCLLTKEKKERILLCVISIPIGAIFALCFSLSI